MALEKVLTILFSCSNEDRVQRRPVSVRSSEPAYPQITEKELVESVRKMEEQNTAPGPDGVPGRVLQH